MNSLGSDISRCHSMSWRTQARRASSLAVTLSPALPSFFRWAAMPSSATRCISSVRISHLELMAAGRGEGGVELTGSGWAGASAMKSLMRPGTGRPRMAWSRPRTVSNQSLDGLADDADGEEIVDLVDGDLLVGVSFLPDGVEAPGVRHSTRAAILWSRRLCLRAALTVPSRKTSPSPRRASTSLESCS